MENLLYSYSHNFHVCFKEKPDVIIEPKDSLIVQVKASEITYSGKYKCQCTMRFPRVERIRDDKAWYDCMTFEELEEMKRVRTIPVFETRVFFNTYQGRIQVLLDNFFVSSSRFHGFCFLFFFSICVANDNKSPIDTVVKSK